MRKATDSLDKLKALKNSMKNIFSSNSNSTPSPMSISSSSPASSPASSSSSSSSSPSSSSSSPSSSSSSSASSTPATSTPASSSTSSSSIACPQCTYVNTSLALTCALCHQVLVTSPTPSSPASTDKLTCPQCTVENPIDATRCSVCGFQLVDDESVPMATADIPLQPFQCSQCTSINEEGATVCDVCGAPIGSDKGGMEDDEKEVQKKLQPLREETVKRLRSIHPTPISSKLTGSAPVFLPPAFLRSPLFTTEIPSFVYVSYGDAKSLLSSVAELKGMKDRTQTYPVETFMLATLTQGLPLFKTQPHINRDIMYCLQYIFYKVKIEKNKTTAKSWLLELARAYQSCQAVQQQTITTLFTRLSNVELTFEHQVLRMIAQFKTRLVDEVVQSTPGKADPHTRSSILLAIETLTGIELDGHEAAELDKDKVPLEEKSKDGLAVDFLKRFSAETFLTEFVDDINQKGGVSRNFDRDKFYAWVMKLGPEVTFDKHSIFYDSDHPEQYATPQAEADHGVIPYLSLTVGRNILHILGHMD